MRRCSPPVRLGPKRLTGRQAGLVASLVACLLGGLATGPARAAEVRLRILATTDLHMNLRDHDC